MVTSRKKLTWQHPSGRWYVRKTVAGKMVYLGRITANEGTAEFDRQYWEIMSGKAHKAKSSWSALIADYRKSERWTGLKPRTRSDYEKVLLYIEEKIGDRDVKTFSRPDAINAQTANAHRVRFANYIVQILVILSEHAIDLGWITQNRAVKVKRLKTPEHKKQKHVPWPDWAVDRFRKEASQQVLLIFELGIGTIQRPGDWVTFCWGDYDGVDLKLRQNKTGKSLVLPCTKELKNALAIEEATIGATPIAGRPILTTQGGRRMSYRYMSQIMLAERKRLGVQEFDLHALRYRGVMELAWSGCDDDQIASFSGHATKEMIAKYAGEARQIMRARQASEKRL